jgi:nucleotide-binding universal stress UspA family protein
VKILIGVDGGVDDSMPARLVCRLRFPKPQIDLMHAVVPITWWAGDTVVSADLAQQTLDAQREEGENILERARALYKGTDAQIGLHLDFGSPSERLLDELRSHPADLVVVGGHPRGTFAAWASGSVGRNLVVNSESSLLVVKGGIRTEGPVDLVIATDHSGYVESCVDQLIAWAPAGFGNILVVTATDFDTDSETVASIAERHRGLRAEYQSRGERLAARLKPLCSGNVDVDVVDGNPGEVLADAMQRTGAELLVLGAQGHGWFDRLAYGSVSYRQVVSQPYPVLVLRPATAFTTEQSTTASVSAPVDVAPFV